MVFSDRKPEIHYACWFCLSLSLQSLVVGCFTSIHRIAIKEHKVTLVFAYHTIKSRNRALAQVNNNSLGT